MSLKLCSKEDLRNEATTFVYSSYKDRLWKRKDYRINEIAANYENF